MIEGEEEQAARGQPLAPQLTEADYRLTGLSLNGHPMRHVRPLVSPNGVKSAREILQMRDGEPVAHAGLVICRQRPGTAKGFVFLTLEDETGTINVVVTPQRFEEQAMLISRSPLLLVRGTLQVESGVFNIRAREFTALNAGEGRNFIQYASNAPVNIDGGSGFDLVVIIGTEFADTFVVTASGVYGAGRVVRFINVERVSIYGMEGDDVFHVLSTNPAVELSIFGGLGSDRIEVGSAAPAVQANDLLGHTGLR